MSFLDSIFGMENKLAVVTGGGRGIGQVIALGFARAGADVAILSRSPADDTLKLIKSDTGKEAVWIKCDVTNEADVDAAVSELMERYGHIDTVFNNAGICIHKPTIEASVEEFRKVVDCNLTGEYIVCRAVAKAMISAGKPCSIINMASMSGTIVNVPQWQCSYNASKAAVMHMTKSLALEWVGKGIRVNSLSPGYIATPMSVDTPNELKDAWETLMPMHRMGKPEELLPAILYLASDAAGYTTGSDIIVDGAYTCF